MSAAAVTINTPPDQSWTVLYNDTKATDLTQANRYLLIFRAALGNVPAIEAFLKNKKNDPSKILTDSKITKLTKAPYPHVGGTLLDVARHNNRAEIVRLLEPHFKEKQTAALAPVPASAAVSAAPTKKKHAITIPFSDSIAKRNEARIKYDTETASKHVDHIKKGRELMNKGMKGLSGRVIIFGPGESEDYDAINKTFDEVWFVCNDDKILEIACQRIPKAKKLKKELTGDLVATFEDIINETICNVVKVKYKKDLEKITAVEIAPILREIETNAEMQKIIDQGIAKIITVLKTWKAKDLNLEKELGKFDYVISSLVASQLATVLQIVEDVMKDWLKRDLTKNPEYMNNRHSFNALPGTHFFDLIPLAKGPIYFADTIAEVFATETITMVHQPLFDAMRTLCTVDAENEWDMYYGAKSHFRVRALLLKLKPEIATATASK